MDQYGRKIKLERCHKRQLLVMIDDIIFNYAVGIDNCNKSGSLQFT
jgi:hypothetical protein